jgi:CRP-like cAMP-binding protein
MAIDDAWDWLSSLATATITLRDGETLFRRGDRVSSVFLLERGCVKLKRTLEDGSLIVITSYREHELIGEASLFSSSYHCDAIAAGLVQLRRVPKNSALAALRSQPDAAMAVLQHLSHAVQSARMAAELRNIRPLSARLLAWLDIQPAARDGWVVPTEGWKDVALFLGASHEALYRTLSRLEADKRIERTAARLRRTGGRAV